MVAVLVAAGLAACGDPKDATDDAGRPLLPTGAGGDGGGQAALARLPEAADSGGFSDAIDPSELPDPPLVEEYRLAAGVRVLERQAPAYRFRFPDDTEERVRDALGVGTDGFFEIDFTGAWYWDRDTADDPVVEDVLTCDPPEPGSSEEPFCTEGPPPASDLPSFAEVEARFRVILEELGYDPDEGTFDTLDHPQSRQMGFLPRIGGLEVGYLESAIGFGEGGRLEFASGFFGTVEKLGDYPLDEVTAAIEAFEEAYWDDPDPDVGTTVVEVTGVELALEVVFPFCDGDDLTLVPVYRLLPEDTLVDGIPAVAEASTTAPDEGPCPGEDALGDPPGRPDERRRPPGRARTRRRR